MKDGFHAAAEVGFNIVNRKNDRDQWTAHSDPSSIALVLSRIYHYNAKQRKVTGASLFLHFFGEKQGAQTDLLAACGLALFTKNHE
jgi:hypothetical protein